MNENLLLLYVIEVIVGTNHFFEQKRKEEFLETACSYSKNQCLSNVQAKQTPTEHNRVKITHNKYERNTLYFG